MKEPTSRSIPTRASAPKYNFALGYLRASVVVLVVANHSLLAYYPFGPSPPASLFEKPRWWELFPVVDPHKWIGAFLLIGFNEMFFMSLLFFLSGLFVWQALTRKGSGRFLRDRALKLGVPFLVAAVLIPPLAYYPAYLQSADRTGGFWHQWLSLGQWPSGPAWFISLLLPFDVFAACLFLVAPGWSERLCQTTARISEKPVPFLALLLGISAVAYVPMAYHFGPVTWLSFGPFTFQVSRIFHYLVYFLLGVGVGTGGLHRGFLAPDGKLARRWLPWLVAAFAVFGAVEAVTMIGATSHLAAAIDFGFALSCAVSSLAFLALFLRFTQRESRLVDSLNVNSYAISLVHYPFVSWLQYALLPASLPGYAKAALVTSGAVAASWSVARLIRRIPGVARVL